MIKYLTIGAAVSALVIVLGKVAKKKKNKKGAFAPLYAETVYSANHHI